MRFVWIDDSPKRKDDAENLAEQLGIKVDFINANKKPIDKILNELLTGNQPDLLIIDHSLDTVISDTFRKGSTAAVFIHEHWPSCPIVSFTGIPMNDIDLRHRSVYEGMFPMYRISNYYPTVLSIAEGLITVRSNLPNDLESLVSLFSPPGDDAEKIKKILPVELKNNIEDKSIGLEILRWSQSIFYVRPGFLYDEVWTATLLGLNTKGFEKVKDNFSPAEYSGIFLDKSRPRWWKSLVVQKLSEMSGKVGIPRVIGQELVENNPKYLSKCYSSGESHPETVAAVDTSIDALWQPMKLKHTDPHPLYEDMLFFEELRIMKQENEHLPK